MLQTLPMLPEKPLPEQLKVESWGLQDQIFCSAILQKLCENQYICIYLLQLLL